VTTPVPSTRFPPLGLVLPTDRQAVSYRVDEVLGEGGTAVACLATRLAPDGESPAVIKIILPQVAARAGATASALVRKEAVALGRLNERVPPTPFVVRLLDVGVVARDLHGLALELPWVAIEYVHGGVEGTTLEERVGCTVRRAGRAFCAERALRAVEHVTRGLAEVHAVGVIHRDLTPANVLCCGSGESELFKLSDFGIARPEGMGVTFGDMLVGTPGYLAPEQAVPRLGALDARTDVFGCAATIYFLLTGEPYFDVVDSGSALAAARAPERRRVTDGRHLAPELRAHPAACAAIDAALARATAYDPARRPASAAELGASLVPWLRAPTREQRREGRRVWVSVMEAIGPTLPALGQRWSVRHPPGDDRVVVSAAWNAAGHCLAATPRGLSYWDGASWADAPAAGLPLMPGIRFVRRLGASTWLIGSEGGTLAEFSREGTRLLMKARDEGTELLDAHGALDEIAVVVGRNGGALKLYGVVGGHWLKPLPLPGEATFASVAQIDARRWLVVGRDGGGRAFAAVYRPLDWELEPLAVPPVRALIAASAHPDRPQAIAVGTQGTVLRVEAHHVERSVVPGEPDLTAAALDLVGRAWVGAVGRLWLRDSRRGWVVAWEDPTWHVPMVGIMAELGFVVVMSVDGAVAECHTAAAG